jgi:hypothetical protein
VSRGRQKFLSIDTCRTELDLLVAHGEPVHVTSVRTSSGNARVTSGARIAGIIPRPVIRDALPPGPAASTARNRSAAPIINRPAVIPCRTGSLRRAASSVVATLTRRTRFPASSTVLGVSRSLAPVRATSVAIQVPGCASGHGALASGTHSRSVRQATLVPARPAVVDVCRCTVLAPVRIDPVAVPPPRDAGSADTRFLEAPRYCIREWKTFSIARATMGHIEVKIDASQRAGREGRRARDAAHARAARLTTDNRARSCKSRIRALVRARSTCVRGRNKLVARGVECRDLRTVQVTVIVKHVSR